jgi:hypothetical protein
MVRICQVGMRSMMSHSLSPHFFSLFPYFITDKITCSIAGIKRRSWKLYVQRKATITFNSAKTGHFQLNGKHFAKTIHPCHDPYSCIVVVLCISVLLLDNVRLNTRLIRGAASDFRSEFLTVC